MTVAFTDVCYGAEGARAACVLADSWEAGTPASTHIADVSAVEPYAPGEFFRRELPCLLAVLKRLSARPTVAVVDGYVWLPPDHRPGLGAHLHEALHREIPVVGVAKTAFAGVDASSTVEQVFRGTSRQPLFVTAVGMDTRMAADCVRRMAGEHRIPDLLRLTDHLARGI